MKIPIQKNQVTTVLAKKLLEAMWNGKNKSVFIKQTRRGKKGQFEDKTFRLSSSAKMKRVMNSKRFTTLPIGFKKKCSKTNLSSTASHTSPDDFREIRISDSVPEDIFA